MTTWNLCLICHHEMAYHAEIDGQIVCPPTDPDDELAPGDTGAKLIAEAFEAMEKVLRTHDETITAIREVLQDQIKLNNLLIQRIQQLEQNSIDLEFRVAQLEKEEN